MRNFGVSSKSTPRLSKTNPGLWLVNAGMDFELTPKLRMINNVNFLWFDQTQSLQMLLFQDSIHSYIGADLSTGFEYRPFLNNNVIFDFGLSTLIPGDGFRDLYNKLYGTVPLLGAAFVEMNLTF